MKKTKVVRIGNKLIGGNNPILVQSMCNTKTYDVKSTIKQIQELEKAGCEIIRVAVPDEKSARALKEIKENINIPLVADIHFDYKLALDSAPYIDKLRINPGNIGDEGKIKQVVEAAKKYSLPIRIGVNLGSLEKDIEDKYGRTAKAMVESARKHIGLLEKNDFKDIVVSLKSSDVNMTIEACRLFAKEFDYPQHLGITEAGTVLSGSIKSAMGLGILLNEGIGSTIRVSLTADPVEEVKTAYEILTHLNLRKFGRTIISCPTCARTHGNLIKIAEEIEEKTKELKKPINIAIMGCEVNGPGEAKHADIGVALGEKYGFVFKKGEVVKKVEHKDVVNELIKEIEYGED